MRRKAVRVEKEVLLVLFGILFFLGVCLLNVNQPSREGSSARDCGVGLPVFVTEVWADVLYTAEEALKSDFPQAQKIKEETKVLSAAQKSGIEKKTGVTFDPDLDKEFHFYVAEANGQKIGYAAHHMVKGKWGPITFLLALEPDGKVKNVTVLELTERRGRPVKERRFLNQFTGKTANDPIKLNKDIKGVAGATVSSRGMADGVRKLVYVFKEAYGK